MRILSQKYSWKIVIVLGALLTFVFAVYAVASSEQTKEETIVETLLDKHISAVNSGDVDTLMKMAIDVRQSPEETRKLYTRLRGKDNFTPVSYTINKITKEGEYILVDTTFKMKDGHTENPTLKIINHEGEWIFYVTP
jgi:hypothetical protein